MTRSQDLRRHILEFIAQCDVGDFVNITMGDLEREFPHVVGLCLQDHVVWAHEDRLLKAGVRKIRTFSGVSSIVVTITGLTDKGQKYIQNLRRYATTFR